MFGVVIFLGVIFGPIIYLIVSSISDNISDKIKEQRQKKHYSKEELVSFTTYKNKNITYSDIINLFLSQINYYKQSYFYVKYKIFSEKDSQNYAWSITTTKESFSWGEIINIYFHFSNGWVRIYSSNSQFSIGGVSSEKYYLFGYDFGTFKIEKTLNACRDEARMTWKNHGKKPDDILPFSFKQESSTHNNSNSSGYSGNNNTDSDLLSFYRNLLGLNLNFSKIELKDAYHMAVLKYHPDRYGSSDKRDRENAEMLMKQVNEAHEYLKKCA